MNKLATALALIAMTAGSLAVTEGTSFAGVRHGKRPAPQKMIAARKGKKSHKGLEGSLFARRTEGRKKVRRHRKTVKSPTNPGMGTISG